MHTSVTHTQQGKEGIESQFSVQPYISYLLIISPYAMNNMAFMCLLSYLHMKIHVWLADSFQYNQNKVLKYQHWDFFSRKQLCFHLNTNKWFR